MNVIVLTPYIFAHASDPSASGADQERNLNSFRRAMLHHYPIMPPELYSFSELHIYFPDNSPFDCARGYPRFNPYLHKEEQELMDRMRYLMSNPGIGLRFDLGSGFLFDDVEEVLFRLSRS